jgi:hypothetical protein
MIKTTIICNYGVIKVAPQMVWLCAKSVTMGQTVRSCRKPNTKLRNTKRNYDILRTTT